MTGSVACWLVSYDLEDDRERLRVANVVEGFGLRVQKSVFECPLGKGRRLALERELEKLKLTTGFVLLYRLDAKTRRQGIGVVPAAVTAGDGHAFIV